MNERGECLLRVRTAAPWCGVHVCDVMSMCMCIDIYIYIGIYCVCVCAKVERCGVFPNCCGTVTFGLFVQLWLIYFTRSLLRMCVLAAYRKCNRSRATSG
jgi:hypothetical protein